MKLWLLLSLCAVAAAAPKLPANALDGDEVFSEDDFNIDVQNSDILINSLSGQVLSDVENRNFIINILIRQLFEFIRNTINNGSGILGLPPLDPLKLDEFHLVIPAGLINLDLHLENVLMTGLGGFRVHRSDIRFSDLSFEIDISVPKLEIKSEQYSFDGDFFTAIPLYGEGGAEFIVKDFRFRALIFLKQSEDGKSVLIDRIQNPSFEIPSLESNLDGVIGGGNIDTIVKTLIQEVIIDYVNRFQGFISVKFASLIAILANPILSQFETWRFIQPFV